MFGANYDDLGNIVDQGSGHPWKVLMGRFSAKGRLRGLGRRVRGEVSKLKHMYKNDPLTFKSEARRIKRKAHQQACRIKGISEVVATRPVGFEKDFRSSVRRARSLIS